MLSTKRKKLTKLGLGNKPNATRSLEAIEVDKLYDMEFFGSISPHVLQCTVWWNLTNYFGFRARDESRKLCFGDIKSSEENGRKFLEWDKERGTKTRTGENSYSHQRAFNPRAYETKGPRCPVLLFEKFLSHRPEDSKNCNSPFYLATIPESKITNNIWFYNRPLGKNSLGKFMFEAKDILGSASTSRSKIANHSARKTSISSLLNNNIHPIHVSQLSGHKNIDSLKSYHSASKQQQESMSDIISLHQQNNPVGDSKRPLKFCMVL